MNVSSPDKLVEAYSQVGSANRRSLEALAVVLAQFRARGIDVLLLKGADLITRLYGVRGLRPMIDADLLVRERDLPAIDCILLESGYLPQIDGNPVYRNPYSALLLDLVTEFWHTDDTEGIWRRAVQRDMADLPVNGMGAEDLLLYLTAYVVLQRGCFSPAFPKDLALLSRKESLNWAFILEEATRHNLKVPLYHGLSYAARHETITMPDHVLKSLAPSCAMEKALAFVLRKLVTDAPVNNIGHFLLFLTRPNDKKWRWLRQYFFPSVAFLNYRYGERGAARPIQTRLRRAVSLAAQALRLSAQVAFLLITRRSPATP